MKKLSIYLFLLAGIIVSASRALPKKTKRSFVYGQPAQMQSRLGLDVIAEPIFDNELPVEAIAVVNDVVQSVQDSTPDYSEDLGQLFREETTQPVDEEQFSFLPPFIELPRDLLTHMLLHCSFCPELAEEVEPLELHFPSRGFEALVLQRMPSLRDHSSFRNN